MPLVTTSGLPGFYSRHTKHVKNDHFGNNIPNAIQALHNVYTRGWHPLDVSDVRRLERRRLVGEQNIIETFDMSDCKDLLCSSIFVNVATEDF